MKKTALILMCVLLLLATCTCATAEKSYHWRVGNYKDEFGDATGQKFTYFHTEGTFSNSATTNEELHVEVIVDLNYVQFEMLEYGRLKITDLFDNSTYTIRVKDDKDQVHTFSGWFSESTSRIVLSSSYKQEMLDILKAGGRIRFSITHDKMTSTKYTFAIESLDNFEESWNSAIGNPIGYMGAFHEGIAVVIRNNKMGAIDTSGNIVVPCIYDVVGDCSDGMLRVYNGEYLTLDGGARMINGTEGEFGFVSKDGKMSIAMNYDYAYDFSCGRAFVKNNGKWGCIDTSGNLIIPYKFDKVYSYNEDIAIVFNGTMNNWGNPVTGTYQFIDLNGKSIYKSTEQLFSFSEGFARVTSKGKIGYINKDGKMVIPATWDSAGSFNEGLAWVKSGKNYYFIDANGEKTITCNVSNLNSNDPFGSFEDGMAYVRNTSYDLGFIDKTGKLVIPIKYNFGRNFSNGYAPVQDAKTEKWGIIDKQGKTVVPFQWDDITQSGEYYRVRKYANYSNKTGAGVGGTYGLIDAQGNMVLECKYGSINYGEGYYTVSKGSEWMVYDATLKRIY